MPQRAELHALVDQLPDREVAAAWTYLHALCGHVEDTPTVIVVDDLDRPLEPESPSEAMAWKEFETEVREHAESLHDELEGE